MNKYLPYGVFEDQMRLKDVKTNKITTTTSVIIFYGYTHEFFANSYVLMILLQY